MFKNYTVRYNKTNIIIVLQNKNTNKYKEHNLIAYASFLLLIIISELNCEEWKVGRKCGGGDEFDTFIDIS